MKKKFFLFNDMERKAERELITGMYAMDIK